MDLYLRLALAGAAVWVILNLALLRWAWRGRRIDDHPLCRRCGFDLTGRPDTSPQCPECGANLSAPKSIRIGHRQRRRGWLAASATALVLFLAAGIAAGVFIARTQDLNPYKPFWLLVRELEDPGRGPAAFKEIQNRTLSKTVSEAELIALADHLLALQENLTQPFSGPPLDALELLQRTGNLDAARNTRYAMNSAVISLLTRPAIREGDSLPFSARAARRGGSFHYRVDLKVRDASGTTLGNITAYADAGIYSYYFHPDRAVVINPAHLPVGKHELTLDATLAIHELPVTWSSSSLPPSIATRKIVEKRLVEVLPRGTMNVRPVRNDALVREIERSARLPTIGWGDAPDYDGPSVWFDISPVGENLAYRAEISVDGQVVKTLEIFQPKGQATNVGIGIRSKEIKPDGVVSITLRPDPELAQKTVDFNTYADVEVRWDNIKVPPRPPTPPPPEPTRPGVPLADLLTELAGSDVHGTILEIRGRETAGTLNSEQLLQVADAILSRQADRSQSWTPVLGDFLQHLREEKILDDARYERFARQAVVATLSVPDQLTAGDNLQLNIHCEGRAGQRTPLGVAMVPLLRFTTPEGNSFNAGLRRPSLYVRGLPGDQQFPIPITVPAAEIARHAGKTLKVHATVEFRIYPNREQSVGIPGDEVPCLTTVTHESDHALTCRAPDTSHIEPLSNPALEAAVRESFGGASISRAPGGNNGFVMLQFRNVPENLAYDVIVVVAGREHVVGSFLVRKGETRRGGPGSELPDLTGPVTIILRPSAIVASKAPGLTSYANIELRAENVPISTHTFTTGPSSRPASRKSAPSILPTTRSR